MKENEIGSQPTMCQVHPGAYISLLAPGKTYYTACHPGKITTCILHAVPITTHTNGRRKSNGKKKKRKEQETKERKEQGSVKTKKKK